MALLATIDETVAGGVGGVRLDDPNFQQQAVTLFYDINSAELSLGFDMLAPTGFTGTTDFTTANTTNFGEFTAHLTNGIDEVLGVATLLEPSGAGFGVGQLESDLFGLPGDLHGDTIDLIRREIVSNTPTQLPDGIQISVEARWNIYGTTASGQHPPTLIQPVLNYTIGEGQTLQGLYSQLLANAQDVDAGDQAQLTISSIGASNTMGFLYFDPTDQLMTYTADGLDAKQPTDRFTYTVSDPDGSTVTGAVDVAVTGPHLPTKVGDADANTLSANRPGKRLIGGDGDDTLIGHGARQLLFGGRGDDTIIVTGAKSVIYGGTGTNMIKLNGRHETVVLQQGGTDIIDGFNLKTDRLDLRQVLAAVDKELSFSDFQVTSCGNSATLSYIGSPSFTGGAALATLVGVGPRVTLQTLINDGALKMC